MGNRPSMTKPLSKALVVSVIVFLIIVCLVIYKSFAPMWNAETILSNFEQHLTSEAENMLKSCEDLKTGSGCSWGEGETPLPEIFKKFGDVTAYSHPSWAGSIKVSIMSGFTNAGVYIVANPTSFTLENISGSIRKITSHGYIYYE